MESGDPKRKMAAILFADIQGYTALMQKDALKASLILKRFQVVVESEVKVQGGHVGNFYGDGALCIFDLSEDAINAAAI